jgi:ubiquinol-cytochrome c reductase cytochrome c subunit
MKKVLVTAALIAAAAPAHAQAPAADAARGNAVYLKNGCHTCHGSHGYGSRFGPRLAPAPLPLEAFAHQTRHPRAEMPRYPAEFVSDQDIADMIAFLASIKPGPKATDIPLLKE